MNAKPAALFEFWRLWTALVMTSRVAPGARLPTFLSSVSIVSLPGQADERQQHEQGGEEREDPVVGQRRGEQRQVVLLELLTVRWSVPFQVDFERSVGASGARPLPVWVVAVSAMPRGLPGSDDQNA